MKDLSNEEIMKERRSDKIFIKVLMGFLIMSIILNVWTLNLVDESQALVDEAIKCADDYKLLYDDLYEKYNFLKEKYDKECTISTTETEEETTLTHLTYTKPPKITTYEYTQEEFDYLCRLVVAEAGPMDYAGQMMVADVVFNRLYSDEFPNVDTIIEVINEEGQFTPVSTEEV